MTSARPTPPRNLGEFAVAQRVHGSPDMSSPTLTMPTVVALHEARRQFMTAYFTLLWRRTRGNVSEIARLAGIGRSHVRRYLRELEIAPASPRTLSDQDAGDEPTVRPKRTTTGTFPTKRAEAGPPEDLADELERAAG